MSDMADFCNEYQDGTMEEYYDYFSGNIHIPDYEQQPHADQGLQVGLLRWRLVGVAVLERFDRT